MNLTIRLTALMMVNGLCSAFGVASAAPMLELTVGSDAYVGRSLAHDEEVCWLAQQDGRVQEVFLQQVSSYRKVDDQFRSWETIELRSRLRKEFGPEWEIVSTGHYLVCAPRGRARLFADSFEELYRSFRGYFSRRGFPLPQPEFPMIAVVYPSPAAFAANCKIDGLPFLPGLKGYYHRLTNRVSLYEDDSDRLAALGGGDGEGLEFVAAIPDRPPAEIVRDTSLNNRLRSFVWDASVQSDLKHTIVHEATHQVAYNLGLHSRIGDNPKWITEGLATMFESAGTRQNTGSKRPEQRLNQERFEWFGEYVQQRRPPKSLAKFIMQDSMFQTAPLDAYAEAWALMFFLAETRSSLHTKYLQAVSARDPLLPYTSEARLTDFQDAFGKDIDRLEVAFLRFMEDLR